MTFMLFERLIGQMPELDTPGGYAPFGTKFTPKNGPKNRPHEAQFANCVSSQVVGAKDIHMPAIDIDVPCRLVESSTPGHFHLYIDHPITWPRYAAILSALTEAGIVEQGYLDASLARGATYLRMPGHKKVYPEVEPPSEPNF